MFLININLDKLIDSFSGNVTSLVREINIALRIVDNSEQQENKQHDESQANSSQRTVHCQERRQVATRVPDVFTDISAQFN